jgi:NAD(P)H-hydrate epimerase
MDFNIAPYLQKLYQPPLDSHKGQNGKLLIVGGSHLFHAASLWALKIASRMVDMVFYSSVPENNEIVQNAKEEFRDGIVVPRNDLEHYAREADCILIGCGMNRTEIQNANLKMQNESNSVMNLQKINQLIDEGQLTHEITRYLLEHHPDKKFVLDAGSLQELDLNWLNNLKELPILTPHPQELETMAKNNNIATDDILRRDPAMAGSAGGTTRRSSPTKTIILLKGPTDIIYSPDNDPIEIKGGVPGMTKGGTGDVLAGLTAALYCKNDALTSAVVASFFNKNAGEELFERMGNNFNASDLVDQLPKTMHQYLQPID